MLKRVLMSFAIVAGLTGAAEAATVAFKGGLVITAKSTACRLPYLAQNRAFDLYWEYDTTKGQDRLGNFEIQDLVVNFAEIVFTVKDQGKGSVTEIRSFPRHVTASVPTFRNSGAFRYSMTMSIVERQPTAITPNTQTMQMRGRISGFGGISTCVVDFRSAMTRI